MHSILIQLSREWDRQPGDHLYGEPFDDAVDVAVGGRARWSLPREAPVGNPKAQIPGTNVSIELHEDGPVFSFVVQHWDQISSFVATIAAVVSAWAATRALRQQKLPPGDPQAASGTVVQIGNLKIDSEASLSAEEIVTVARALASTFMELENTRSNTSGNVRNTSSTGKNDAQSGPAGTSGPQVLETILRRKKQLTGK